MKESASVVTHGSFVERTECPDERHDGVSQSLMLFRCDNLSDCGLQNTNVSVEETAESSSNDDSLKVACEAKDEHADSSSCKTDQEHWFTTEDVGL